MSLINIITSQKKMYCLLLDTFLRVFESIEIYVAPLHILHSIFYY